MMTTSTLPPSLEELAYLRRLERAKQQTQTTTPVALGTEPWRERIITKVPHSKQGEFLDSPAKRKVIRAGRRGGKTVGESIDGLRAFKAGRRVLYAAPTREQIDAFWFEICLALDALADDKILYKNETEHLFEVPGTKNRIRAKTAWNANTLRGDYADKLILDEWQLMAEDTWDRAAAPMLMDNNGDVVFCYTPPSLKTRALSKATDPRHAAKLFKAAQADKSGLWQAFHFTSYENPHISAEGIELIASGMTRLSREQEILAEDDVDIPGALWRQAEIDALRITDAEPLSLRDQMRRIVVAIDPMGESGSIGAEAGIIVAGLGTDRHFYVLEDVSLSGTPDQWARAAVQAYYRWNADRIVAEKNYGGQMVEGTLRTVDSNVPLKLVTATRGKLVRAEPVAALYEQKKAHHVGEFPQLESEQVSYLGVGKSPNRMDACVWAGTDLMLDKQGSSVVR
jgi:hypothetical protein